MKLDACRKRRELHVVYNGECSLGEKGYEFESGRWRQFHFFFSGFLPEANYIGLWMEKCQSEMVFATVSAREGECQRSLFFMSMSPQFNWAIALCFSPSVAFFQKSARLLRVTRAPSCIR